MCTDDFQPESQEAPIDCPFRQKVLHEIASILPNTSAKSAPPEAAEAEEPECGNIHPIRDLNVTNFVRQVDSIFLHRWLEGYGSNEK